MMLPILGYAETHYSFLPGLSLISRKCPEIIADAPTRVDPGQSCPILLVIKDADKYPVRINRVEIVVFERSLGCVLQKPLDEKPIEVKDGLFSKIYELPVEDFRGKTITVNVRMEVSLGKRAYQILNDNLPMLSHRQLQIHIANEKLPCEDGWHYGDAHIHTAYSNSHVEFGPPISATARMAKAMGLSWFVAADHSYDLMCAGNNYLKMDPSLSQWDKLQHDIAKATSDGFTVLRGEEVSAGNSKGRNVHVLAMGNREFIRGSGDGARRKWNKKPEHNLNEVASMVHAQHGLCFSAHPFAHLGWLHRFALNRGGWSEKDLLSGMDGLQFWCGSRGKAFYRGRKKWVELLLQGKRMTIVAGTDAHGDFNRIRKLKTPFVSLEENPEFFFGRTRTCIRANSAEEKDLLQSLHEGRMVVTDGPFLSVTPEGSRAHWKCFSTGEFGRLDRLRVFTGTVGKGQEEVEKELTWRENSPVFEAGDLLEVGQDATYIRGELTSRVGQHEHMCMTNPVWLGAK